MNTPNDLIDYRLIESGLESEVYRVKDFNGCNLILKRRKPCGKQNYLFEAYVYKHLKALGVLVPEVVRFNTEEILMIELVGCEMDDQNSLYSNEQLFSDIAQNLALCGSLIFQGFGPAVKNDISFVGKYSTWLEFLNTTEWLFESPYIIESGLRQSSILKLSNAWRAQKPKMTLEQAAIVHGDLSMSSLFVEKQNFVGIIDFGDAFIGDPIMDIAYFGFKEITKSYGKDVYRRLLSHYANYRGLIVNKELERKIMFYMIYWGLKRLEHCPNKELKNKFLTKLETVADSIYEV